MLDNVNQGEGTETQEVIMEGFLDLSILDNSNVKEGGERQEILLQHQK